MLTSDHHWGAAAALVRAHEQVMGSNAAGTSNFQTPLARQHLARGRVEVVPLTPPAGLEGFYVTVQTAPLGAKPSARYYRFSADPYGVNAKASGVCPTTIEEWR